MSEKDKFDEVFKTLKQASYVFCNNVDGDVDDGKNILVHMQRLTRTGLFPAEREIS